MKYVLLSAMLATLLTSCRSFSTYGCTLALHEYYGEKVLWIRNVDTYENLVFTKDSTLLLVSSFSMTYPYISKVDTILRVK